MPLLHKLKLNVLKSIPYIAYKVLMYFLCKSVNQETHTKNVASMRNGTRYRKVLIYAINQKIPATLRTQFKMSSIGKQILVQNNKQSY